MLESVIRTNTNIALPNLAYACW